MLGLLLTVLLVLLILGGLPEYGVPHNYGYAPSGVGAVLLIVVLVLLLSGRL